MKISLLPKPRRFSNLCVLILAAAGLACGSLPASTLGLTTVKQPLYMHSDADPKILILDVPVASSGTVPEGFFPSICLPFVPASDDTWKERGDINLASLYKIKLEVLEGDTLVWKLIIDASAAKVPEGYPFTIEQVVDSVETCIKMMHPTEPADGQQLKIEVKMPAPAKAAGKAKDKGKDKAK